MTQLPKSDFCIEINYGKGSDSPSRVFQTMYELIEECQNLDRALVGSIDSKIEPLLLLEDIEAGSIKSYLSQFIKSTDDDALKDMSIKKLVGAYLVKGKYRIINFLDKKTTVTNIKEVAELQSDLLDIAKETNVNWLPYYRPMDTRLLLEHIYLIQLSLSHLDKAKDGAKYIVGADSAKFNLSFNISPESLKELITKDTILSNNDMKMLDSLGQKKRIPKQRRYVSGSRQTDTNQSGDVSMGETAKQDTNNLPAIFESDTGKLKLRVDPDRETIWATQDEMASIFGVDRSNIVKHITKVFEDGELDEFRNVQKMHFSSTKPTNTYTLDVILSVGYRVNTKKATIFRQWATQTLSVFIRDGAVLDEDRLSRNPDLQRRLAAKLRHLRTSEVSAYAQVREVFKMSASDYDGESQAAKSFFAMAQDKFHYAVTSKTAAEIKLERANPLKHNMGLINIQGKHPTLAEANVAKNYLSPDELRALENISEQFLLFAESKAFRGHKMTMEELSFKLNTLLTANDYPVLYEYKNYLAKKAEDHIRDVFDTYQAQLEAPKQKQIGK